MPAWSNDRSTMLSKILKVLLFPLTLVRLLLFGVALVWLALTEAVCMLIPIGLIRYPIYRFLTYVGCVVALLALGIISSADDLAEPRRLKLKILPQDKRKMFDSGRGSLIIVNHQGFIDVLLLGLKLAPIFVFPASDGTPVQFSLFGALRRAATCQKESATRSTTLEDIMATGKSSFQSVVIFPEGMRTVGNCVLAWKDETFKGMKEFSAGTGILSIEYVKSNYPYTPQHTVGSMFWHAFWLCCQLPHTARIVWLPTIDVAEALKSLKDKPFSEHVAKLRNLLSLMIPGAVEVSVGADMHLDFMAYWNDAQKKRYTKTPSADKKKR